MRSTTLFLALLGTALAVPHPQPQSIDVDGVDAAADPVMVTPPMDVTSDTPDSLTTTAVAPVATATAGPVARRWGAENEKRDGTCNAQPKGAGPLAFEDTPEAFLADQNLQVRISTFYVRLSSGSEQFTGTSAQCFDSCGIQPGLSKRPGLFECVELYGTVHNQQI